MPNNILFVIQERLGSLSNAEKKLAEWVLEHSVEVIHMNVTTLSQKAESSPATVVRLCYSLGLDGFTDLKLKLSTSLPQIAEELHTDIVKDEEISQIKKKLHFKVSNSFTETMSKLDDEMVERTMAMMDEAQVIYTYGIGASGLVAEDIYQKLTRIGKNVFFSKDYHLTATALATNPSKGILFAISNSGEKSEAIHLGKIAKERGIDLVVMTKSKKSSLGKIADVILETASGGEAALRSSASSSLLVQLFTVDILFSAYASRHYDSTIERLSQSKAIIKKV